MLTKLVRRCPETAERDPESGVTLIEMMVVLVIIAIVAALIVPNVIGRPDEARVTVARTDVRTIASSLEMYRLDNRALSDDDPGVAGAGHPPGLAARPAELGVGRVSRPGSGRPLGQSLRLPLARRRRALRSRIRSGRTASPAARGSTPTSRTARRDPDPWLQGT